MNATLSWLVLALAIFYVSEPLWRLWRHRPGKWTPLHIEVLLPTTLILLSASSPALPMLRVPTVVLFATGTVLRLLARKRFRVPTWPTADS